MFDIILYSWHAHNFVIVISEKYVKFFFSWLRSFSFVFYLFRLINIFYLYVLQKTYREFFRAWSIRALFTNLCVLSKASSDNIPGGRPMKSMISQPWMSIKCIQGHVIPRIYFHASSCSVLAKLSKLSYADFIPTVQDCQNCLQLLEQNLVEAYSKEEYFFESLIF